MGNFLKFILMHIKFSGNYWTKIKNISKKAKKPFFEFLLKMSIFRNLGIDHWLVRFNIACRGCPTNSTKMWRSDFVSCSNTPILYWAHPLYGMLNLTNKWTGSRKL